MLIDPFLAPQKLLEVMHVAHRLSVSPGFVRRLIRDKKLKAILLGTRWRVDPIDLQAFIDAQRVTHEDPPGERSQLRSIPQSRGA